MAYDAFLKLDGIPGGSLDSQHPGELEINSYSFGATVPVATGGTVASGKVQISPFTFTASQSPASVPVLSNVFTGKRIPLATLTLRSGGDKPQDFYTIKLSDVLVSSVQEGMSEGGDAMPTQQVQLTYGRADFTYRPVSRDGVAGKDVYMTSWTPQATK
jgi:type VI secretion system secreted protein Hcp